IITVLIGLFIVTFIMPFMKRPIKEKTIYYWSKTLMWICGVRVKITGQPLKDQAVMWVANHVSWIDIFVLNSCRATSFIAKQEIKRWPLIGWLVQAVGTIFIDRNNRRVIRDI